MPGKPTEGNGASGSCGENKGNFLEAVDVLAVWIAEDVTAVAQSFRVQQAAVLKKALARIESDLLLEPDASDSRGPEKEMG